MSLHETAAPVFTQMLDVLRHVLAKGRAHAEQTGGDPPALLQARLAPDMLPLLRQVQIATDHVKGAMCRLAGEPVPSWPDEERTFDELDARIGKALDLVAATPAAGFEGAEEREVTMDLPGGRRLGFAGRDYLLRFAVPNLFFHVTTAYAILRANGVPLGKPDFLGGGSANPPPWMRVTTIG